MMAEVYWDMEWELQQQGFDYTYDKRHYVSSIGKECRRNLGTLESHSEFYGPLGPILGYAYLIFL